MIEQPSVAPLLPTSDASSSEGSCMPYALSPVENKQTGSHSASLSRFLSARAYREIYLGRRASGALGASCAEPEKNSGNGEVVSEPIARSRSAPRCTTWAIGNYVEEELLRHGVRLAKVYGIASVSDASAIDPSKRRSESLRKGGRGAKRSKSRVHSDSHRSEYGKSPCLVRTPGTSIRTTSLSKRLREQVQATRPHDTPNDIAKPSREDVIELARETALTVGVGKQVSAHIETSGNSGNTKDSALHTASRRVMFLEKKLSTTMSELDKLQRSSRATELHVLSRKLQATEAELARLRQCRQAKGARALHQNSRGGRSAEAVDRAAGSATSTCTDSDGAVETTDVSIPTVQELMDVVKAREASIEELQRQLRMLSTECGVASVKSLHEGGTVQQVLEQNAALKQEVQALRRLPQELARVQKELACSQAKLNRLEGELEEYGKLLKLVPSSAAIRSIIDERDSLTDLLRYKSTQEAALRDELDRISSHVTESLEQHYKTLLDRECSLAADRESQLRRSVDTLERRIAEKEADWAEKREALEAIIVQMEAKHQSERDEGLMKQLLTRVATPSPHNVDRLPPGKEGPSSQQTTNDRTSPMPLATTTSTMGADRVYDTHSGTVKSVSNSSPSSSYHTTLSSIRSTSSKLHSSTITPRRDSSVLSATTVNTRSLSTGSQLSSRFGSAHASLELGHTISSAVSTLRDEPSRLHADISEPHVAAIAGAPVFPTNLVPDSTCAHVAPADVSIPPSSEASLTASIRAAGEGKMPDASSPPGYLQRKLSRANGEAIGQSRHEDNSYACAVQSHSDSPCHEALVPPLPASDSQAAPADMPTPPGSSTGAPPIENPRLTPVSTPPEKDIPNDFTFRYSSISSIPIIPHSLTAAMPSIMEVGDAIRIGVMNNDSHVVNDSDVKSQLGVARIEAVPSMQTVASGNREANQSDKDSFKLSSLTFSRHSGSNSTGSAAAAPPSVTAQSSPPLTPKPSIVNEFPPVPAAEVPPPPPSAPVPVAPPSVTAQSSPPLTPKPSIVNEFPPVPAAEVPPPPPSAPVPVALTTGNMHSHPEALCVSASRTVIIDGDNISTDCGDALLQPALETPVQIEWTPAAQSLLGDAVSSRQHFSSLASEEDIDGVSSLSAVEDAQSGSDVGAISAAFPKGDWGPSTTAEKTIPLPLRPSELPDAFAGVHNDRYRCGVASDSVLSISEDADEESFTVHHA